MSNLLKAGLKEPELVVMLVARLHQFSRSACVKCSAPLECLHEAVRPPAYHQWRL